MDFNDKAALRRIFSARRRALSAEERRMCDRSLCSAIRELPEFAAAEVIAAFIPWGAEPDLSPLFCGKKVLLPRFDAEHNAYEMVPVRDLSCDLRPGKYGIPEPLPRLSAMPRQEAAEQALFLVPAVAVDASGTRLGRGGGYYDRLLAGVRKPPVAVIYSCQFSASPLPRDGHDVPMGIVVTEKQLVRVTERKGEF